MAAEGEFPKDDGDTLYASEVNAFGKTAGEGIDISAEGEISGEDASTSNKGIASFNSTDFSDSSGAISVLDTRKFVNKKDGAYTNQGSQGTVLATFDYDPNSYTYLQIYSDAGGAGGIDFTIGFYSGGGANLRQATGSIPTLPAGGQVVVTTIIIPKPSQYDYPMLYYTQQYTSGGTPSPPTWGTWATGDTKHTYMDLGNPAPDTIKLIKSSVGTQWEHFFYQYYQL